MNRYGYMAGQVRHTFYPDVRKGQIWERNCTPVTGTWTPLIVILTDPHQNGTEFFVDAYTIPEEKTTDGWRMCASTDTIHQFYYIKEDVKC